MNSLKKWATSAFGILILVAFLSFIFQNCGGKEHIPCGNVKSLDNVKIDVNGANVSILTKTWDNDADSSLGIMSAATNYSTFLAIKNALFKQVSNLQTDSVEAIVLYLTNNSANDFTSISLENIEGFSLYDSKSNYLSHRLFSNKENSKFYLSNEFQNQTSGLIHDDMRNIANLVVPQSKKFRSYMLIYEQATKPNSPKSSTDELTNSLQKYRKANNLGVRTNGKPRRCKDPCCRGQLGSSCHHDTYNQFCDCKTDCGDDLAHDTGGASEAVRNNNFSLHYQFRDNFLLNSSFGQTYMGYYVALSEDMATNLTPTLALEILDFFTVFNPSIAEVLKPSANQSSYILISPTIHAKAKSIISNYKAVTTDANLLTILTNVESDLDKYLNQPASYVLNDCCH